ncbi:uncharacterized protein BX663DRAFT_531986 [Cokeromyces recurvatus]|uniref:uncharacterized protein n=1 Tax=Cokeromyces recurvatus TaxID=90255 RepID=UPI00221F9D2A|nr:uncharacterized protein BX663DRAFT_531986 [Cokeromyces recurvatus]KAI7901216.1 hypothetical protein BX663DRAFT_531986 [Cokeromyces recurvatus]
MLAPPSHPGLFKVVHQGNSDSFTSKLVAECEFKKDQVIVDLKGLIVPGPKRYSSVQISANEHVELNSDLLYLNHSCDPNTFLDVSQLELIALRDVHIGDELLFFYPSTEWDMAQAFDCWCGSSKCIGKVRGAHEIPTKILDQFKLNNHIIQLVQERDFPSTTRIINEH